MYKTKKRIPTLLALVILFMGIGTTVYLDKMSQSNITKALEVTVPEDVRFSNISDNSFTISWFTSRPSLGSVIIKNNSESLVYIDDLDSDNIPRPRTNHYVTVKNLGENSVYSVKISGNGQSCNENFNNCPVFSQKTGNKLPGTLNLPPVHGTLITKTNQPVINAIVYVTIAGSSLISARTDSSGLWVIPLSNLRSKDLWGRIEISDNDPVSIYAKIDPLQFASAVIDMKSVRNNTTIPPIQIGETYNFIKLMSKNSQLANSLNQNILGTQTNIPNSTLPNNNFDIIFPQNNGDTTVDNQPRFRGTGLKNKIILITVNSSPQIGRVVVGADGTWVWRPDQPIAPGNHTINIQAYDDNGQLITITRQFIVLKSGESVLGEATSSATLTPTRTPTAIPTISITNIPIITITTAPTTAPTISVSSPTITIKQPPPTGNFKTTLLLSIGGGILLFSGLYLIFIL